MPRKRVTSPPLNRKDQVALIVALQRAIDWSDLYDNGKLHGALWRRREAAFLKRCQELIDRLRSNLHA